MLDLWKDNFQMVNLTQIMCQKDDLAFAALLNRMRVKQKTYELSDNDRALLKQAIIDVKDSPPNVLHIFATNKEVDVHNSATVAALYSDFVNIKADDFTKEPTTGEMMQQGSIKGTKRDLPDYIQAPHGVWVMVIRNLDVEDGIVNGTFEKIANIVTDEQSGQSTVRLIGLQLNSPTAGQKFHLKIQGASDNLVYIERSKERLCKKVVV